jgi:putative acetyltransferase
MFDPSCHPHLNALRVRSAVEADDDAIREVLDLAFSSFDEEVLANCTPGSTHRRISLVAELESLVVGRVFLAPVTVEHPTGTWAIGMGPLAVHPDFQDRGIGSVLVREGLEACRAQGERIVFVFGHPPYFHRFGFQSADQEDFTFEGLDIGPAFMVLALEPEALKGVSGEVHFLSELDRM